MVDTTRQGLVGRALRRFWPVALVVALAGGLAAAWAADRIEPTWTAEGEFIVPIADPVPPLLPGEVPPPPSLLPATAYDAGVAARTYELVLESDTALLADLSTRTGIPVAELVSSSDIVHVEGTRVIRITFTGTSEEQVRAFFTELAAVVETASPTANLPTGNLRALNVPAEIDAAVGVGSAAPIIGALAGLLLGLAAAVLLERMDSRLTGPGDLRAVAGWPVFDLGSRHAATAAESAVLRILRSRPGARQVAVVTAPRTPFRSAAEAADELAAAELRLRAAGTLPDRAPVLWEPFGRLADDGYAERGAQTSDAVVAVVPRRAAMRAVTRALQSLQDLGLADVVAVVPGTRRDRRGAAPAEETPSEPTGADEPRAAQPPADATQPLPVPTDAVAAEARLGGPAERSDALSGTGPSGRASGASS